MPIRYPAPGHHPDPMTESVTQAVFNLKGCGGTFRTLQKPRLGHGRIFRMHQLTPTLEPEGDDGLPIQTQNLGPAIIHIAFTSLEAYGPCGGLRAGDHLL